MCQIKYANAFHIDLPIYYHDQKTGKYFLGSGSQWIESDPKEFTAWFSTNVASQEQMLRVIKYFKAWADNVKVKKSIKMPSGIALTIWVQQFYVKDSREDLSFIKTAYQILKHLSQVTFLADWECLMPVKPFDNLIEKLTNNQRENFLTSLGELMKKSEVILGLEEHEHTTNQWSKILGKWFPVVSKRGSITGSSV